MKICPTCLECYEDSDVVCVKPGHKSLVLERSGTRLIDGKYRLARRLGKGGTGAVYSCTHLELNKSLALKLLHPDFQSSDPNGKLRLRREALTSCSFAHENLVRLLEFGNHRNTNDPSGQTAASELYIVMELVDGETLKDYLTKHGQLTFGEAIEIARQIAQGLEEVHSKNVVHRDLKPANLMLTHDRTGRMIVKILDFGSVKRIGESQTDSLPDLDLTGQMFIGSPRYSSPESCEFKAVDGRSDLYCLGLIFYEMIAGHRPYEARDFFSWLNAHVYSVPDALTGVPDALDQLVMRMLRKNPDDRPASAGEFLLTLLQVRDSLGKLATKKALLVSAKNLFEDEVTRIAAKSTAATATVAARDSPVSHNRVFNRSVAAVSLLVISVIASLSLTLSFVRNSLDENLDGRTASTNGQSDSDVTKDDFLTVTDVNIRIRPSGLSDRIGLAEKGSRVRVIEKRRNWRRVKLIKHGREKEDPNSADEGWIDGTNLTTFNDNEI